MSIEPVGMSRQLHSLEEGREGRGRRAGGYERLGLSHMGTLLRSHMFTEQGIKLKWIGESRGREIPSSLGESIVELLHVCNL